MEEIKTIVYFDLEATGLKSSGKPRISELSLVAVNVKDILGYHLKIRAFKENIDVEENMKQIEKLLPRVLNKLTICVYPMATIVPYVSSITGLDNYNLSEQARFDKNTVTFLNSFLCRLPPPVCLIAHNGDFYDFPLLKAEMQKIESSFSLQIMCADSYIGIKEIFKNKDDITSNENHAKERRIIDKEVEAATALLIAGEFEHEFSVSDDSEAILALEKKRPSASKRASIDSFQVPQKKQCSEIVSSNTEKQLTPFTKNKPKNIYPMKMKQLPITSSMKSKKKLTFSLPSTPTSYSLINLHNHLFGCLPAQSHGAEADCLTLLRITSVLGEEWLNWLNNNYYEFTNCKAMWGQPPERL